MYMQKLDFLCGKFEILSSILSYHKIKMAIQISDFFFKTNLLFP